MTLRFLAQSISMRKINLLLKLLKFLLDFDRLLKYLEHMSNMYRKILHLNPFRFLVQVLGCSLKNDI